MHGPWAVLRSSLLLFPVVTWASVLDDVWEKEDARKLVTPFLSDLKQLDTKDVETVVRRQWWDLAQELLSAAHMQGVDLASAVRSGVRNVQDEASELLAALNPTYGKPQLVSPAFQWAQNSTCVFLNIKFTKRWNAPGALEVQKISVNITNTTFNFTGFGHHSNNRYLYSLSLGVFDLLDTAHSSWSGGSVGKLSVVLRKKFARKWPRLLVSKKTKIANMHLWRDMQEKSDASLYSHSAAQASALICGLEDKVYCSTLDKCLISSECADTCTKKPVANEQTHTCGGPPTERALVSFEDTDPQEGKIGGEVRITKPKRNEFDIDDYVVYWGKNIKDKLGNLESAESSLIGEVPAQGSEANLTYSLEQNTHVPTGATHLLVFSKNAFGEYEQPGYVNLIDAATPQTTARSVMFEDTDGDVGEVGGRVTITRAIDEKSIEEYSLHWGKSPTKKTAKSHINDVAKKVSSPKDEELLFHYIPRNTALPASATHLLVFAKNENGEMPTGISVPIKDNTKPCVEDGDPSCVLSLTATPDEDPDAEEAQTSITITPAESEEMITAYSLYWGTKACDTPQRGRKLPNGGAKNGHIMDISVGAPLVAMVPANTLLPEQTTHILVFPKGTVGLSDNCKSVEFEDSTSPDGRNSEL